jgi:hypothetical protein
MKENERYIVRICFENEKTIIKVQNGMSNFNNFFEQVFKENPEATEASVRRLYNPLFSEDDLDDGRIYTTRNKNKELHKQNYLIKEKEVETLSKKWHIDSEEVSDGEI